MLPAWHLVMAKARDLVASRRRRPRCARTTVALRPIEVMELEDRTLLSATPAGAMAGAPTTNDQQSQVATTPAPSTANVPLAFEQNQGQTSQAVDFVARGDGFNLYLSQGNATLAIQTQTGTDVLKLDLVGANTDAMANGQAQQAGHANYLVGNDATKWITDVPLFGSVVYQQVYNGVDVRYYGQGQQLEYDFNVAPGADASQIRLALDGAQSASLDTQGNLVVTLPGGDQPLVFRAPSAYQETDAGRQAVESRYTMDADGQIGFALGTYDATRALVIDPLLDYGTFLGGANVDQANGISVDASGSAYLVGQTQSLNFPVTAGAYDATLSGSTDVFVAKLDPTGSSLSYATYLGGSGSDDGLAIAVDAAGNAYVTGNTTSNNFPTLNAYQNSNGGGQDAFLAKLNAAGSALMYSTYFGGTGSDVSNALAIDNAGNAYIAGNSDAPGFILLGLLQLSPGSVDTLVAGFDTTKTGGASNVFDSSFGGAGTDVATGVALDAAGQIYITGYTNSGAFPTTAGAYNSTLNGSQAAFLSVVAANHSSFSYSTYLGGTGQSAATGIALDASNHAYLTGWAKNGFPITAGAYQTAFGGGSSDAFVAELDPTLSGNSSLVYATYLGGGGADQGDALAVDSTGSVFTTGSTTGSLPTTADAYQPTYGGSSHDAFFATLGAGGGNLVYATYLGGSSDDVGTGIATDGAGGVYLAGYTNSSDFQETTAGAASTSLNGGAGGAYDGFALKFTVSGSNTAPTLNGANNLTAINEDDATSPGTLVSSLIAGQVTDPDPGALSGIAVTAVDNTNGAWQYSTNGGTSWLAFGAPSIAAARLLAADANTLVRFVPAVNWNGTVAGLTFLAWDLTSGTIGGTADVSVSGGTTAFSATAATSSITVNSVNDAPAGMSNTVATTQNTTYVFTAADFSFSDPLDAPPNVLLAVKITTLPAVGTLTDNGVVVTAGQFVPVSDINAGLLLFTPVANTSGTNYASFAFQVQDNGGTANGGVDLDPTPKTMTIDVNWVNHAPVLSGANNLPPMFGNAATNPGTPISSIITGQVNDADVFDAKGIAVVAVDNTGGTWQYSTNGGATWTAFGTPTTTTARLLAADASTLVRFVPNANWYGTVAAGITFRAWDQTSGTAGATADVTVNGGTTAFSAATASTGITVNTLAPSNGGGSGGVVPGVPLVNPASNGGGGVLPTGPSSTPLVVPKPEIVLPPPIVPAVLPKIAPVPASVASFTLPAFVPIIVRTPTYDMTPMAPLNLAAPVTAVTPPNVVRPTNNNSSPRETMTSVNTVSLAVHNDLDELKRDLDAMVAPDRLVIGSALGVTSSLTIGYIVWMLRGGMLLSSLLAQMPAWRLVDPLMVLSQFDDERERRGRGNDESLESILAAGSAKGAIA